MTKKELTAAVKTLITSSPYVRVGSPPPETYGSGTSVRTSLTTVSKDHTLDSASYSSGGLDRAQIAPSVLRDLWVTKFGAGWVDGVNIPDDYAVVQRQLWFAGLIQKMYRPDTGREVWRIFDADS